MTRLKQTQTVSTKLTLKHIVAYSLLIAGAIGAIVFFATTLSSKDSEAAKTNKKVTLSSYLASSSNSGNSFFAQIKDGDTLQLDAELELDNSLSSLKNRDIILMISANGTLTIGKGNKLELGSGSEIIIDSSGTLQSPSANDCDNSPKIFIGSKEVTNCQGTTTIRSFDQIVQDGGVTGSMTALPVSWLSTSAEQIDDPEYRVSWSTASELNNNYFVVEYLDDSETWIEGATVESLAESGNSQNRLEYSAEVTNYSNGQIIFRVKQVDFDGAFDYSSVAIPSSVDQVEYKIATLGNNRIIIFVESREIVPVAIFTSDGAEVTRGDIMDSKEFSLPKAGVYIIELGELGNQQQIKHLVR